MTSEHLLHAIGQLDDELVAEAAAPARRPAPRRALAGLAAALVLCAGVLSARHLLPHTPRSGTTSSPASPSAQEAEDIYQYGVVFEPTADGSANRGEASTKGKSDDTSSVADSTVGGIVEPRFITPRGTYLPLVISGDALPTLPVDALSLGTLQLHPCDEPTAPTTLTESLVGCPVWESRDGTHLYIQTPTGWILAALPD